MRRGLAGLVLAAGLLMLVAPGAAAHPLGNFTVSRFARLDVRPRLLVVEYAVDMAEIPTFQQRERIDANGDDELTPAEADAYALDQAGRILDGLTLTIDGEAVRPSVAEAAGGLGEGQGGLAILRLDIRFEASLLAGTRRIRFVDGNDPDRAGWREIVATASCGASIAASTVPEASVSEGLRRYPPGRLSDPLDIRQATVEVGPEAIAPCPSPGAVAAPAPPPPGGFAGLVARERLSAGFVLVALLLAMGFGAIHALGPGHGKTVTAAYLAGTSGSGMRHAAVAGVAVALMHTASVLALGLVALAASSAFPAETVYPWIGLATGLAVAALGGWLLRTRLRERTHAHARHAGAVGVLGRGRLAGLAAAGGLLPSPAAVVVLTGAIALGRLAFGLVLVAAFSAGLALALVLVGGVAVKVRTFAEGRFPAAASAIPLLSAAAVLGVGVFLTVRAIAQLAG
jgi:nickel/cobalt transporter (NicO) family protein